MLAISGDLQPGGSDATLAGVGAPTLNNLGQVVLQARLVDGVGGVGSNNDAALWFVDGAAKELLAWKGAGDLSGGTSYASFAAASIADDGDVVFKAMTDDGKQGLWRAARSGARTAIAVTLSGGGVPGPGLGSAQLDTLGFQLMHAPGDVTAFNGRMKWGVGGVDNMNARGLWLDTESSATLVVREYISEVPGLDDAKFLVPAAEGVNNSGQMAALGSLVVGYGNVTTPDALALVRIAADAGLLVARRNSGDVAGVEGASFAAFSDLRINSAGAIAYAGELSTTGDVTTANNRGLWLFDGTANRLGHWVDTVLLGNYLGAGL